MLIVAAALELIGTLLVSVPIIKLLVARIRVDKVSAITKYRHADLVDTISRSVSQELMWPSIKELYILLIGVIFLIGGCFIKIIYYSSIH